MLDEILELQLIIVPGSDLEELDYLIKQLECADLAKSKFVKGEISFADFCDIAEVCNVNVDEYFIQIEQNLTDVGIL